MTSESLRVNVSMAAHIPRSVERYPGARTGIAPGASNATRAEGRSGVDAPSIRFCFWGSAPGEPGRNATRNHNVQAIGGAFRIRYAGGHGGDKRFFMRQRQLIARLENGWLAPGR